MSAHSENARQWVHIGSGGFALLLRVLSWPQAALLALTALAFNVVALPRVGGRRLYRPADAARGFPLGILLYPVSVLALILTFRSRLDLVAAAWGVLAFGDGFATLVGRRIASHAETREPAEQNFSAGSWSSAWIRRLPWNPDKSVAGTTAFVVFGGAGAIALASWTSHHLMIAAPLAAALAAALVESIPVKLDDNVSVPFAAGAVLGLASLMDGAEWSAAAPWVIETLPWALAVNLVVGWIGYRAKTVSVSGYAGGVAVGVVIFAAGGANAWLLLFLTFAAATIASKLGLRRKTLRPVAAGTPGAMSVEGTMAGLAAAIALGTAAIVLGLIGYHALFAVVVGATVGALVESVLGATLEGPGILNNDMLNFINTAIAAVVALALA
jgi:dolichol kinase